MYMAMRTTVACSRAILVLLWLINHARSHQEPPWTRGDHRFLPSTHRDIEDWDMSLRNVHVSEINSGRRKDVPPAATPSDALIKYIQSILDLRQSNYNIYRDTDYVPVEQRVELILRDIANQIRSNSRRYIEKQDTGNVLDRRVETSPNEMQSRGGISYLIEPPEVPDVNENHLLNEPTTHSKLSPLPRTPTNLGQSPILSLRAPLGDWALPVQHYVRRPAPSGLLDDGVLVPPPWAGMVIPPSLGVFIKSGFYSERFDISPSPNYDIMDLLSDLMSLPERPLIIEADEQGGCRFIKNIIGPWSNSVIEQGHVNNEFEWRIGITNRDGKEVWKSECLPQDTLKLRFGYNVTLSYTQRYGLDDEK